MQYTTHNTHGQISQNNTDEKRKRRRHEREFD